MSETLPSNEPNVENIVDIDRARFIDQLPTEYEDMWTLLTSNMATSRQNTEQFMFSIWLDESMPQAFRDRALLGAFGTREVCQRLNINGICATGFRLPSLEYSYEHLPIADKPKLVNWVKESLEYQVSQDLKLLDDSRYMYWALNRAKANAMSLEEMEWFFNNIDVSNAMPRYDPEDDDNQRELPYNRFPLIYDVIYNKVPSSPNLKDWAWSKLSLWLEYQKNPSSEVPEWLKTVSTQKGMDLYTSIFKNFGFEAAWPGIELFGWQIIVGDGYRQPVSTYESLSFAKEIKEESRRNSLVTYLLQQQTVPMREYDGTQKERPPLVHNDDDIEFLSAIVTSLGDEELVKVLDKDKAKLYAYQAASEHAHAKRDLEYNKRQSERQAERQREQAVQVQANLRLEKILESMRTVKPKAD